MPLYTCIKMDDFVKKNSVVRKIWGKSDTILFIFAGAAAEFALNRAVDWLYYTGRLPSDPLGRLFSTVAYARRIVFSERETAYLAIDKITQIHTGLEKARGASIPDWAYRDVLYLLIHYSIASFELLERKLSPAEQEEVYDVFRRVGVRMQLRDLPPDFRKWQESREAHMKADLLYTHYTTDLFLQYKKHLGVVRFALLKQAQLLVLPQTVKQLLRSANWSWLQPFVPLYKLLRSIRLDALLRNMLLPPAYKAQIKALDIV